LIGERTAITAAMVLATVFLPLAAHSQDTGVHEDTHAASLNNGEDITRPVTGLELKYQFEALPHNSHQDLFTLTGDYDVWLNKRWVLGLTVDVPFVYGNSIAADNPGGKFQFGIGDVDLDASISYVINHRIGVGVGVKLYFPTAYYEQAGTGKYRAVPILGLRISLPEISHGSFFQPIVKYDSNYASRYADGGNISKLEFGPMLNIYLPMEFYITLYSSTEIVYDFINGQWAIPFNFMVGKFLTKKIIISAEFFIPMINADNYRPYDFKTEAKIAFFF